MAKFNCVFLYNDTVNRRIKKMFVKIVDQVPVKVRSLKFGFAIQIESIDVTNCCQLLVYLRFAPNDAVKIELLMSKELSDTKKENMFSTF